MFVSSVNRLLGAVLVFTLLGCVPATQTGTSYSRGEARTVQQVQIGKVIEVTEITIEGTKSGAGGLVGGAVGGIAGGSTGYPPWIIWPKYIANKQLLGSR